MVKLNQTVGWNTESGPICLQCYVKLHPINTISPIMQGIEGGVRCFSCKTKLNKIEKELRFSIQNSFIKMYNKDFQIENEEEDFYENLPRHPR